MLPRFVVIVVCCLGIGLGCGGGSNQPPFSDLFVVKGVVMRGNDPVKGGAVRFQSDSDKQEFLVNSEVGSDGTFSLITVRTTDKQGERKPGAPAGKYKVMYYPNAADQTAGGSTDPIELSQAVTVEAKENNLKLELPKKK
jgi:hypothetical protein